MPDVEPGVGTPATAAAPSTGRERDLATLGQTRAELTDAQRLAHIGSWYWDAATDATVGSDELLRIYGFDPATDAMPSFAEQRGRCYPPSDWERVNARIREALRTGIGYELDVQVLRAGVPIWVTMRGEVVRDADGRIVGLRGTVQDITERKRAEEAVRRSEARYRELAETLRANEERLRLVLHASAMGTFEVDLRTGEGRWNDKEFELLGLRPGEVPDGPASFFRFVHPADVAYLQERWEEATRLGTLDAEFRIVRPDGEVRWLAGKGQFAFEGGPRGSATWAPERAVRFMGVNFDITNRKQAEEAIRESREDLNRAQAVARTGSWRLDVRRDELVWSDESWRIFGAPRGTPLTYETFLGVVHPDDRAYVDAAWSAGLRGEPYDVEHRILVDGQVKWVRERAELEFDAGGTLRGGFGTTQDITEQKRGEEALRASEEALRLANESLEQNVQQRTVDLARTIAALEAEVAQREEAERALRQANEQLAGRAAQLRALAGELTLAEQRERRRMARVLHDHLQQLLVGAKFRAAILGRGGDASLRAGTAEIEALLDESIRASRSLTAELSPPILHEGGLLPGLEWLARWMADKHGLAVDLLTTPDVPPLLEDVKVLLFESVRELLFNAVKHAGVHTAAVRVRRAGRASLHVTVSDDGPGFEPAELRPAGSAGGGFGLFSIRERLGLVGGRLEIESAPGQGSRITLVAPVAERVDGAEEVGVSWAEGGTKGPLAAPSPSDPDATIRVLLADDHAVVRQGLASLLGAEPDIEVVGEASDGHEAVLLAARLLPDVILMDMSMPGLSGVEATRAIHEDHPDIRVIGLSMFEESERARAMKAAGACDYFTKSGPASALIAGIRGSVGGR